MKDIFKVLGAVALVFSGALPAVAAVEVPMMTCADFTAMDAPARLQASNDVLMWIHDANNVMEADNLIGKYATGDSEETWNDEKLKIEIEGHCIDADPGMLVIERLKTHS